MVMARLKLLKRLTTSLCATIVGGGMVDAHAQEVLWSSQDSVDTPGGLGERARGVSNVPEIYTLGCPTDLRVHLCPSKVV
jgi:hypothetical protein